ncbi:hypothetical protein SDC9_150466 [bioreactor metagenome]|uniref:Uncharacterized protein n=1 Tax=bioreactor metagenome TaxID=1076179 RepID=A0A645EQ08_9ZZZZ
MVKTPVVATLAEALPLMQPTNALDMTAALAGPPMLLPVKAKAMSMKRSDPRVASRKAPKMTNMMMMEEAVPSGVLKTPAELT